jgi:3'-phosphoadenosine 5'-phosphosulfate sulfotransferase (PAPS reductase)/FAD synthetase
MPHPFRCDPLHEKTKVAEGGREMRENRHQPYDLKQMQSLPLEAKILMTKERIRQWYEHWEGQVYVSFSGGKDSTVLKHIVDSMYDDVPSVFVNTGLEFLEIQRFVKDIKSGKWDCFNTDIEILRPEMRFDEVLKIHGYPVISKEVAQTVCEARKNAETGKYTYRLKKLNGEAVDRDGNPSQYNIPQYKYLLDAPFCVSTKCCDIMKKHPAKKYEKETGRKPLLATMAAESRLRYSKWMKFGCNAFEQSRPTSQPMSFWTEQDILHYLKKFSVPYCTVYGDIHIKPRDGEEKGQINLIDYLGCYEPEDVLETTGCDRTGCIFCMFGCHLEKEPNRFQRLKETHPRQYAYCIGGGEMVDGKWRPSKEGLGLGHVLDYIGVPY